MPSPQQPRFGNSAAGRVVAAPTRVAVESRFTRALRAQGLQVTAQPRVSPSVRQLLSQPVPERVVPRGTPMQPVTAAQLSGGSEARAFVRSDVALKKLYVELKIAAKRVSEAAAGLKTLQTLQKATAQQAEIVRQAQQQRPGIVAQSELWSAEDNEASALSLSERRTDAYIESANDYLGAFTDLETAVRVRVELVREFRQEHGRAPEISNDAASVCLDALRQHLPYAEGIRDYLVEIGADVVVDLKDPASLVVANEPTAQVRVLEPSGLSLA